MERGLAQAKVVQHCAALLYATGAGLRNGRTESLITAGITLNLVCSMAMAGGGTKEFRRRQSAMRHQRRERFLSSNRFESRFYFADVS